MVRRCKLYLTAIRSRLLALHCADQDSCKRNWALRMFRRRRFWVLLIIGAALLIVLALAVGPLAFRVLLPFQIQAGIARRIPGFTAWVSTGTPAPTREYTADSLPTSDPGRAAAALSLLEHTGTSIAPTLQPTPT